VKVLFVSPSFYPAFHYGGPTFINRSLCDALGRIEQLHVEVLTTDSDGPRRINLETAWANHTESYTISYCRRIFRPDISLGLLWRLPSMINRADVVHLNGVYSFTTIPTLALCRLLRKPLVWSTMGALQRWQGTTRKKAKRVWERVCDSMCDSNRVLMHVTSEEEKTESLEKILNAGAFVLRNGIDIANLDQETPKERGETLRLLYLGRLHPIKGIENLLKALTLVTTKVRLDVCGAGEANYEAHLHGLVDELQLTASVQFHGRIDGEDKDAQFRRVDLCIAPSFKEAFCTVLLESMARGVPVIASRGIPWQRIEEIGCGLWVNNDPEELASAIDRAAAMPLPAMGLKGHAWMQREYSWTEVAEEMCDIYRRMILSGMAGRSLETGESVLSK
jgi:glycosyltransferase involved in cell wall biosynthesis